MNNGNEVELIKQGAEAKLYKTVYLGKVAIIKERFPKKYRNPLLDEHILKDRMRSEAKGLLRSKVAGVSSPAVYCVDMETRRLYIEYIQGITVKDYIDKQESVEGNIELDNIANKIGSNIAKIHKDNLIHGDLTTSNMLIENTSSNFYLIDFGLSFVSAAAEDKGVDLYVLERALTSTHAYAEKILNIILKSYANTYKSGSKEVLKKYEEVKARGRKRTMIG